MCTRGVVSRAAPCTCRGRSRGNSRSNSKCGLPVGWRVGSGGGGRRESVHGGSVAPSMALTPPQPDPPRLRQFSAICWNGSWGQIRFPAENGSDPGFISIPDRCVDQGRHLPTAAEICQRWGGVGVRGVSRMDAAAKPPGTDSRRPRTPTPPRPPTECPLLTLTLLLRLPASGRHYRRCRAASPAETLPDHDCSHLPECPPLAKVEELT